MKKLKQFKQEVTRTLSMLELASVADQTTESLQKMFNLYGVERSIERLNEKYNTNLRLGKHVIRSVSEQAFWSNDFGWCFNKSGATGYSDEDLVHYTDAKGVVKPKFIGQNLQDAEFVEYASTKDFPPQF